LKGVSLQTTFVLDTNVLLFDPNSVFKFGNNNVFIPLIVIEELDRFKRDQTENGRNARYFSRLIDDLRSKGSLIKGVKINDLGILQITALPEFEIEQRIGIDFKVADNLILRDCMCLQNDGKQVKLISKDINLRLKADALGIEAEDYETSDITLDELYQGQRSAEVAKEVLTLFEQERFIPQDKLAGNHFYPNEYVYVTQEGSTHAKKLGRFCKKKNGIVPLIKKREGVWGIHPKNEEQQFAMDALLNEEVKLVSLLGKAGTGKTLMAIAAGLETTVGQQLYTRLLVSRPVVPMGRDIGFLPGDVSEKLGPWMQPIFDNIDYLFGSKKGQNASYSWEELINQGVLHIEPLTYIRGRSLPSQFIIVDEAQNLSPHEIKTIITRAGEGTKIVLTGDSEQIDNPYLDSINNGLVYCIDKLKEEDIVSHSVLKVGERSHLSEIATQRL
jgi:PhoH-like ATPase